MSSENIGPRGCRFIAGDPGDALELGESIYCGKPASHPGSSWCAAHQQIVFLPPEALAAMRKAA
jgi:hypothetical protein